MPRGRAISVPLGLWTESVRCPGRVANAQVSAVRAMITSSYKRGVGGSKPSAPTEVRGHGPPPRTMAFDLVSDQLGDKAPESLIGARAAVLSSLVLVTDDDERDRLAQDLLRLSLPELVDVLRR